MKLPTIEVGIDSKILNVDAQDPRNNQQTSPVAKAESIRVNSVSSIESSTNLVLSKLTPTFISGGRVLASSRTLFLTA